MSVPSNMLCINIIVDPMENGIPKPITSPNDNAKLVAASAFLSILPSRYSGSIGLNPSLNTATPRFANIEANPLNNALTKNFSISFLLNFIVFQI